MMSHYTKRYHAYRWTLWKLLDMSVPQMQAQSFWKTRLGDRLGWQRFSTVSWRPARPRRPTWRSPQSASSSWQCTSRRSPGHQSTDTTPLFKVANIRTSATRLTANRGCKTHMSGRKRALVASIKSAVVLHLLCM